MEKKDIFVVAVGLLIIIFISSWVIYGSADIYNQSAIASEATGTALVQQRDLVIKKLIKQNEAKQEDLILVRKVLDSEKQALDAAKAEMDASKKKLEAIKAVVQ